MPAAWPPGKPRVPGIRSIRRSSTPFTTRWSTCGTPWAKNWGTKATLPWATTAWAATATPRPMWKKFRAAVVKYLVPVADSIYREQARRLGKQYPMNAADNALMFRSGNPKPCGDADAIVAQGKKVLRGAVSRNRRVLPQDAGRPADGPALHPWQGGRRLLHQPG